MFTMEQLTIEEQQVIKQIERYFKSANMQLNDKLYHALLIAQHELESHNFSSEWERAKIVHFRNTVDSLMKKLNTYQKERRDC